MTRIHRPRGVDLEHAASRTLAEHFEATVATYGEQPAIEVDDDVLTYAELAARARRLARHLRTLGVGPEQLVGLHLDRSIDALVALLAVTLAGGAYLPLDPAFPDERLRLMVRDSGARVVLTDAAKAARFAELEAAGELVVVRLDRQPFDHLDASPLDPLPAADPSTLAYVLYTSGSTGRPKGVGVPQSAVALLTFGQDYVHFAPGARVGQVSNHAFDVATFEIWGAWLTGGALVVMPPEVVLDLDALCERIATRRLDILFLPTALFDRLAHDRPTTFGTVGELVVGGEALDPHAARAVLDSGAPPRALVNGYGPTECTAFATSQRVDGVAEGAVSVPIGLPLASTTAHVSSPEWEPTAVGEEGELWLGGPRVARGYLHRPRRTAEHFVPDPFQGPDGEPGARLYRTGDMVRRLDDGTIDFIGRRDHQIKLRGFRIELGEIEAVLGEHPDAAERLAMVREDRPGDPRLVAYVASEHPDPSAFSETLRELAAARLPEAMIPQIVVLPRLPLTPNGKVDRRALPAPERRVAAVLGDRAPRGPAERWWATLFEEVLGVEAVGRDESFVALGGHSLDAARMVVNAREALGVEVSVGEIFEQPTVAELAAHLARRGSAALSTDPDSDPAADREGESWLLSAGQERLWFLYRLDPTSVAYSLPWVLELRGALDIDALSRSLDAILERHPPLRMRIVEIDGEPRMQTRRVAPLALDPLVLDAAADLDAAIRAEIARPLDLTTGPTVRFRLLQIAEDHHALVWTAHHIAYDLSSYNVTLAELEVLYPRLLGGSEIDTSPLDPLEITYGDHVRRLLDRSSDAAEHWERALAEVEALDWPLDRPRPAWPNHPAAIAVRRVDAASTDALRQLARSRGRSTVFPPTLAAFAVLLRGLTTQSDLLIGVPVAGRDDPDVRPLIGFFVDVLAVRLDIGDGEIGFADLLDRAHEAFLEAYRHPQPPSLNHLVDELARNRQVGANPFFPVTFQLAREPGVPELPGLDVTQSRLRADHAKFDLRMDVYDRRDHLSLEIEYDTELFDPATIERWLDLYVSVLEQAIADPHRPIAKLSLVTDGDRAVIERANDNAATIPGDLPLIEQVRRHVRATPDKTAVVDGERRWTWGTLGSRVDRLAAHLAEIGVRPGDFVGLCVERGAELPLGMLGILAAGGAYAALDPSYPDDRLRFMIDDAGLTVLVVQRHLVDHLPEVDGVTHVVVDELLDPRSRTSRLDELPVDESPAHGAFDGDFPACLIYTSGSTGTPKASVLPQRGVTRLVVGTQYTTFTDEDVFTQTASPSFDAATFEVWGALLNGGTLVVVGRDDLLSPDAFGETLRREGATVVFLTTAYFQQIARRAPEVLATPRAVFFGGERCEPDAVRRALDACRAGGTQLFHAYGPSECTTYATVGEVAAVPDDATSVPIGEPVANTIARVVDSSGREVPVGVAGELWLGGPGLALAYHDRPRRTAERFVPDPFGGEPGARLYRTGDRVRWLTDGRLDFLGRVDHQVKLRGFRIEPGEIETVLEQRSDVADALVMVREDVPGDRHLVAYVTKTSGGDSASPSGDAWIGALREHLEAELPAFMMPSAIVTLGQFPLTANGKVDRRQLPAPVHQDRGATYREPESPTEVALAALWREALNVERVGLDDDLFGLGGHSLIVVRLVSRLRDRLDIDVPVRVLFERPTVAGVAAWIADNVAATSAVLPAIDVTPSDEDGTWPLSYGQERLWFLDRLEPGQCLYNVAFAVELSASIGTSGLDPAVLDAALSAVVRRHRVLHTVYGDRDGVPFQRLRSIPDALLHVDAVESDDALDRRVAAVARRPFDLSRDLMLRALLVRTPQRQVLALVIHHIAFDGWSVDVLLNDLRDAVGGLLDGAVDPLPALPIEITDHACWQRRWLDDASLGEGLGQWAERLAELPPLALPTDRPRPAIARFRGARHRFDIPAAAAVALRRLGRELGATPFMTTFAAFQALLARWSGQDDFAIGTPSAGRDQPGTAPLVGFFVNTLVLRGDLGGDPSFREIVERARRVAIDAFGRQDVPFEHVVDAVVPERSLAYNPLAQVFFAVQTPQVPDELAPGVGLTFLDVATGTSKFDLTLTLEARGDAYKGLFEYDRDLFDATTIARMARALCRLIDAVVEDPSRRLGELPLLDAAQQHHVVAEHARRDDTPPVPTTLDAQVLAHAARDGSAIAIVDGAEAIDFATLDRRSRRLAERLVAAGCRPEEPIGLALDRSLDLIVAMLGVLRAGGAYLPLDPAHPDERRRYLVDDAGLRLVVMATDDIATDDVATDDVATDDEHDTAAAPAWLDGSEVRRLVLDDEPPTGEPLPVGDPAGLAYVLYTSGSTGRPKGVACGHAGVGRLLGDFDERAAIAAGDRCAWWTSPNFDVSVYEIFSALTAGATVVVVPESVRLDGAAFAAWLDRERIASAYVPPFLLAELAASLDAGARPPLRRLLVGVEPIAERLLLAIRQRLDGLEVINGYGPTEATVCSTLHRVAGVAGAGATPIGRPVLGTTVDLLDRQLQPVPPGVAGEVHLGGDGLARGYFGRPALTAERFVPDPFAGRWGRAPGARVYRTGDLARRRHDGIHCFVGRRDFQVKLFGHRIELGEIETALDGHPAVARSVVVLREDTPGRPRLVAYVTGDAPEPRALREHLRDRLPDYMVPASILPLDALPVTPNGKVDRRALPAPVDDATTESVAPRTSTEVALVEIYRDVLDIEAARPLGVDDDFFGLGGHSLLAARVSARVQQRFDVELPLHDVFRHPTVAELAQRIDASVSSTRSAIGLGDATHDGESVPLTFGQSRLWFLERLEPGTTRYNMPFGFDLDGPLDAEALRSSLLDVVERHEILRSTFHAGADGPEQRVGAARLPWSLIDLASTPPAERAAEADRIEARFVDEPFDLDSGPVLRALLLRFGGDLRDATAPRHRLLLVVHHIAFDGYSLDILLRELGTLYRRRLAADIDVEPLLPPLPAQVADHAVAQRRQWPESRLATSLDARLERLAGVPPLELPLDRPRVVGGARPIGIGRWIWPEAVIDGLEAYARARGTTVFTVLLAGFEALVGRISGQDDFAVALAVASRERADVQDSIGFFVETLLSRARLDGDPSFDDLVERVRADVLDALAHQQLPLDRQLDGVDPSRRAGDDALTRVLFVQQGEVPRPIELAPGVVARAEELVSSEAKFDLLVSAARTDEGLRLDVEWDAALFDRTTVRRWFAAYGRMLAAVAEKGLVGDVADQRISRLPIDDRAIRHLESIEWNDTATAFPADHTLSQLFAEVVAQHADAEAVRDAGLSLSYAELAGRSRRLARVLRRHGVGFDDRVGVLLERSADLLVALLAVIEAGAAYVPLDPSHPADRLAFMLADSGARLLLTGANAPRPATTASCSVVELDDPTIVAAVEAEADGPLEPWPAAGPDQLAYLIYTSGSTGRPKGVAVPQRGVVRLVRESDYVRFQPGDRVAQVSNASFDVATFDIWGAWLNGGASVVIRTDVLLDADRLAARLAAERIDVMFLTAALFHQTALRRPEAFGGVRDLLAGGEAVDPRGARAVLRSASPPRRLINGYGPTECTTFGTSWRIDQVDEPARSVPIGRPIGATVAHVVGADLSPVPIGGVGELLLGGPGLARGYHGRPARTATSFVPDPFGAEPGERLYRTGDVVRRLADGSIDFLGRRDHQVKLRGFRIELGEIESVLEAHPAVTERLVMVREDRPGDRRLVAYVARRLDDAPDPATFVEALRALAADHLPDYMVPTLVVLDALPLTPNGKVDRRALPSPEPSTGTGAEHVEPSTETEVVLAPIFAELLGLDQVSIVDDFFALGGHSLLAARLVAHVEQRFDVELPLDAIFHAPTVAQLAARLDAVLSADDGDDDGPSADLPVGPAPLSFGQSRLWFLERLDAGSTRYHMPFLFDFDGPLDAAALRAALLTIVERHEVLRTTYHDGTDGPEQRVGAARLPWSTVDLTELPAAERDGEAERLALACAREPFDLEAGPMLRALLLRRTAEPSTHRLVLVIHHIAFDGHSLDVLVGELRTLYGQHLDGITPVLTELPDLPMQVADHARAQRRDWTEERLAASLDARLARLAGVPPLDLPADRARDPQSTRPAGTWRGRWPSAVADGLEAYARGRGSTLFMVLLAGFETLLGRVSGQDDFAIAIATAGRERAGIRHVIGFFVETLLSRAELAGDPSFDRLLDRVRADVLDAFAHQSVPLDRQLDGVDPGRRAGDDTLARVVFVHQGEASRPREMAPGLVLRTSGWTSEAAKFELLVSTSRAPDGLRLDVEWDADRFDSTTVRRWMAAFGQLLAAVAGGAGGERISRLPIDNAASRHQRHVEHNDTATAFPAEATLSTLFADIAERHPTIEAARDAVGGLTYAELAARARRLARVLRRHGVGLDDRVAIRLDRSNELLVAILAVIEAGAAYVPLDPAHPSDRLAFMLVDSGARLLLTDTSSPVIDADFPRLLLDDPQVLDTLAAELDGPLDPPPAADADQLAYLVYTSGSTGRPKGVAVAHRSIARLVLDTDYVRLEPGDRVAQFGNASFDAATFEIWGPWLTGGTCVVIPQEVGLDPDALTRTLVDERIDTLFLTTALFVQVSSARPDAFGGLRDLLTGGESHDPKRLRAVLDSGAPPRRLMNVYGPTECTTYATWQRVRTVAEDARTIPIGRPIGATVAHVVGADLSPVPAGAVGELVLGGPGLARGYHGRPARTAESFVPDPFGDQPGARLYRTGDIVRLLADGAIDFVGRRDHQIKLRGFRIELGEIESVLEAHPAVAERLVMVREDRPGDRRLVAYVARAADAVGALDDASFVAELRRLAVDSLPEVMVPSIVVLDALPLTPNGKIDRRALPVPDRSIDTAAERVAPRNPIEERLVALFAELLDVPEVGIHDDFFTLGGHSLLATRLVAAVRAEMDAELPLVAVFDGPTVAELAVRVAADSTGSETTGSETTGSETTATERKATAEARTDGALPLTFGQSRLWFLDRLEPGSTRYHMPFLFDLEGPLDPEGLRAALLDVVERHEILRTTYHADAAGPEQRVGRATVPWTWIDLVGRAPAERDAELEQRQRDFANAPFDLETGPVLRAMLACLDDGADGGIPAHRFMVVFHHIAFDGYSIDVLLRDLGVFYQARRDGVVATLPSLPTQVVEIALDQRREWTEARLQDHLDARLERLGGVPPLDLPFDRAPSADSLRPSRIWRTTWPSTVTAGLDGYAREHGSTLFRVLLAGFEALLGRLTGQDDFALAIATAGRERTELQDLIGFFVETVLLRADLTGDPTFDTLVGRVRADSLDAFAHQGVPLDRQLDGVDPERRVGDDALARVVFVHQGEATRSREWVPGVALRADGVIPDQAKFALLVSTSLSSGRLVVDVEWDGDLFDRTTIVRWLGAYGRMLAAVAQGAGGQRISRLPIDDAASRHQRVIELNDTATSFPRQAHLSELFAESVARHPDREAVRDPGASLTYAELASRSRRLARLLRRRGVGLDDRVAIGLERSTELLVAILAVVEAGAAYVPLDPAHPAERLAFMLDDSGARLLLTESTLHRAMLPAAPGSPAADPCPVLLLDESATRRAIAAEADGPLDAPSAAGADPLAYLVYTSGSTGRPKGVAVPHRGVVRLVRDTDYVRFVAGDRVAQFGNASFDALTFEIWGPWLAGGSVVVIPSEVGLDPDRLASTLADERVDVMFLTAALFDQVAQRRPDAFGGVRDLLAGGEAVDPRAARAVLGSSAPPRRLINGYGPTECTTFAVTGPISNVAEDALSVPIGRPIGATVAHVVGTELSPVPLGGVGELVLGGAGLARGYHGRPARTAESFVPDPFGATPGARLYRTGDLVRRLADGSIDFVGRRDHQVKLRGFRIELGEIESVLEAHPAVAERLVMVRDESSGERRLVAYVTRSVAASGEPAETASTDIASFATELRALASASLPEVMVPAIVVLDALPLTPNGKVDRRALPAPDLPAEARADQVAPRDAIEATLAELFADLLGVTQVGVHDDFFALGGHSLLATRLAAAVREVFGAELPLAEIFDAPTVAGLADSLRSTTVGSASISALTAGSLDEPAPLSFSQERQWFLVQLEPESAAYNVPNTVYLAGELDIDALRSALGSVVERHAVLRTTFHDQDGEPYQRVGPSASELPSIDLSDRPPSEREAEARQRARAMAARPFDLAAAPPMRVELLRLAPADHRLIVVVHHIVFDGWSTGLFVQELAAFYAAEVGEGVAELPELPLQFVDYARWQRHTLAGAALDRRVEAGRQRLADTPPILELPTDHPRPIVQSHASAMVRCDLDASLERGVRDLARAHGASVFMVLLAAFGTVLGRWAMQSRFNIGTFAANRQHRELESLIGFFVNTLVLPIDLHGRPSFATLLARVRESALAAFEHQDLPFEKLLEVVDPERHVDRSPLFQAMLVLQSFPTHRVELPDLEWRVEEIADEAGAHVDLTLWLAPTGDGLEGVLQFCPDLFEPATIEGLVERFRRLIAAAVAEPERPIDLLPLLTPTAHDVAIAHGRGPKVPEAMPPAVHLAVLDVAARRGDLPAVVLADGTTAWTYAELIRRVTTLAGRLRALGVEAETRVGLCLERDPWMPVSILAVLAAGGAWVPVEASIPEERQRAIFEDAGVAVVLATGDDAELLGDGPWTSIDPREAAVGEMLAIEPARPAAEQAAYVIYTSGSTGKPKGVVVPHGALARFTAAATTVYDIDGDDRVLQFASPTFDTSIEEIFPCLTRGATLILRDREMLASPAGFWSRCGALGVSVLDLPTAYWHELTAAIERGELVLTPEGAPRLVILGGERARPDALAIWRAHAPAATRLVNSYGPTESTVVATAWTDDGGSIVGEVPIGMPLPGLEAHVLSPELEPVAVGVPGELCLAGTGLARGYLGLPAVTADAFVPSPVAERPGERLYRTGDRVRRLANGDLEFLGRLDHQVKIRGFRVELGEIENVLREQPDVDDAVVVTFEATPGQPRLAAYVAAVAGGPDQVVEWISVLRQRLPDYMVPMSIQRLDVLPMTSSGKVDRRALPDPDLVTLDAADDDLPPETPTEVRLAEIYAELLGVERVGVLTSFFDLGGHSLLVPRLLARIARAFDVRLPMAIVFEAPSVAELALVIEEAVLAELEGTTPSFVPSVDFVSERRLDPAIQGAADGRRARGFERVLLTGATGFVGAFLAREILRDPAARLVCAIRAETPEAGLDRLRAAWHALELTAAVAALDAGRVEALPTALDAPRLGLDEATFAALACRVDAVIHSAAAVDAAQSYDRLAPTNVEGTTELLRLSMSGGGVPIHHLSTFGVFNSPRHAGAERLDESTEPDPEGLGSGYDQSKWVAEQRAFEARRRHLPVSVYRFGVVSGDTVTGVGNAADFVSRWLRGCLELGVAPDDRAQLNLLPVDYLTAAIVHLARRQGREGHGGETYHLVHPRPFAVPDLYAHLRTRGHDLDVVPYPQWHAALTERLEADADHPLGPFLPLFPIPDPDREAPPSSATSADIATTTTDLGLADSGLVCPPIDETLLDLYLGRFERLGLLPQRATRPHPAPNEEFRS